MYFHKYLLEFLKYLRATYFCVKYNEFFVECSELPKFEENKQQLEAKDVGWVAPMKLRKFLLSIVGKQIN